MLLLRQPRLRMIYVTSTPIAAKISDGVVGPGRLELAAAMGAPSVVVCLVLGQDQRQMPLAEDQHPVGNFGPGDEHEPFRISVRARSVPGRSRISAARTARSAQSSRGRGLVRRSTEGTPTWCHPERLYKDGEDNGVTPGRILPPKV